MALKLRWFIFGFESFYFAFIMWLNYQRLPYEDVYLPDKDSFFDPLRKSLFRALNGFQKR